MRPEGLSASLKVAFLEESARTLPDVTSAPGDSELGKHVLMYPAASPVLGSLDVSFDGDEITLFFGPRGHHQHYTPYPEEWPPEDWPREAVHATAREAVGFIKRLVEDEVVVRWGFLGASTRPNDPGLWRSLTPWVREAVWSGRRPSGRDPWTRPRS